MRLHATALVAALSAGLLIAGCELFAPSNPTVCHKASDCPRDFRCVDGQCLPRPDAGVVDAGRLDATTLDGAPPDGARSDVGATDLAPHDVTATDHPAPETTIHDAAAPDGTTAEAGPGDRAPGVDSRADAAAPGNDASTGDAVALPDVAGAGDQGGGLDAGGPATDASSADRRDAAGTDGSDGGATDAADASTADAADASTGDAADASATDATLPGFALFAAHPAIARPGTTIWLEGRFPAGPQRVQFVDGSVPVELVQATQRLAVTVPAGARSGYLRLEVDGELSEGVYFQVTSYQPRLGAFSATPPQTAYARDLPRFADYHARSAVAVLPPYLYLVGGHISSSPQTDVWRSRLQADGSLGGFEVALGTSIAENREGPGEALVGQKLYLLSGEGSGGPPLPSSTFASFDLAGNLGPFSAGPDLNIARQDPQAVVLGSYLYVIAGRAGTESSTDQTDSIERALIHSDGVLGPFVELGNKVKYPRDRFALAVVGEQLYLFGGTQANRRVEHASIASDGSISDFTPLPDLPMGRRAWKALVLPDQVCLMGGEDGDTPQLTTHCAQIGGDDSLGSWQVHHNLPDVRAYYGLAVAHNRAFLISGHTSNSSRDRTSLQAPLHQGAYLGAFERAPIALPEPRSDMGCAVVGDKLFLLGGVDTNGDLQSRLGYYDDVLVFGVDPGGALRDVTRRSGALDQARARSAVAVTDDVIYLLGGERRVGDLAAVSSATIGSGADIGAFAALATLPNANSGPTPLLIGPKLYLFGGDGALRRNDLLSINLPINGTLTSTAGTLSPGRVGTAVAVIGAAAYLVGGDATVGITGDVSRAPLNAATGLGAFVGHTELLGNRSDHNTLVLGTRVQALGGARGLWSAVNDLLSTEQASLLASGSLDDFATTALELPDANQVSACVVELDNWVHVLGGRRGSSTTAEHYRAPILSP